MWLYKLISSLWYFKENCSRCFTLSGMRPSTLSFILEVKFRGTYLSEVPKPLQSGVVCGSVFASMSKTWLLVLRVIQCWSESYVFPQLEVTWALKIKWDDAALLIAQHVVSGCKSCDLYSRGSRLEHQLGQTLFNWLETLTCISYRDYPLQDTTEDSLILKFCFIDKRLKGN